MIYNIIYNIIYIYIYYLHIIYILYVCVRVIEGDIVIDRYG